MTPESFSKLKKLIRECKKHGIQSIKVDGIELMFLPYSPKTRTTKKDSQPDYVPTEGMYTDEEILNWSVPGAGPMHG